MSASAICCSLPGRLEKDPSYFCILSVLSYAFKATFLFSLSCLPISLTTCHTFLLALCRHSLLPRFCHWCIDVYSVNIIHLVLSCSSLVPSFFFSSLSVALQCASVSLSSFFAKYSLSPKTPNNVSSAFIKENFLLHSHWLTICFDSSWLLFLPKDSPVWSRKIFVFPLSIDLWVGYPMWVQTSYTF